MRTLSTFFKISLFIIVSTALYKEIYVHGVIIKGAFYYFTIQSNILVAFCLLLFIFMPWESRWRCLIRGTSLLAITLTGIIYNFVLYKIFLDWGTSGFTFTRTVTHIIAPLGFISDWILFDKHNMMKIKDISIWLAYPIAYCLGSIYLDYRYSFSIYFFLNSSNGYGVMAKWLSIMSCLLIVISLFYVAMDRVIGYLQNTKSIRRGVR